MKNRPYFLFGLLLVIAYLLPAFIAGENHFVLIHDFLDSTVAHLKSMKDNGIVFDNSGVIPILCGIPRSYYLTAVDLKVWLFLLLPPYWAVIANIFLIKFSAFAGLFLLLRCHVLPDSARRDDVSFLTAALFALVPFYPDYGISSAGVPLVAYSIINLFYGESKLPSLAILVYYALFSWLVLGGVFVCICTALVILVYFIRTRRFPLWPFIGLCLLTAVYVAANWQLFVDFFVPVEAIHREEFKPQGTKIQALGEALAALFVSQYHAGTCCAFVIVTSFILLWHRHRGENRRWDHLMMALVSLASLMVFTAVVKVMFRDFKLVQLFQFDRFFFLYPALCYVLLGAVLQQLSDEGRRRALSVLSAVVLVTGLAFDIFFTNEVCRELKIGNHPGFREFYDEELFDEIKSDLDIVPGKTRVACLGMYQSVAEYNGIWTVDGYIQIYPLEYKHRFQKVIQKELDKDPALWDYFCNWGTRCYLFSSELGRHYMLSRKDDARVSFLDIDCGALSDLGCEFILSAVEILNSESLGLELAGEYSRPDSYWNIRAYKLK